MAGYNDSLASFIKKGFCKVIDTLDKATAILSRKITGDAFGDTSFPAAISRLVCDRDIPATAPPPFTGGQCCDKPYSVFYSHSWQQPSFPDGTPGATTGPFSKRADLVPGKVVYFGLNESGQGVKYKVQKCDGTLYEQQLFNDSVDKVVGLTITSVVPTNGGADNCGDPIPQVNLPSGWNSASGPMTYTNNEGNNITVPVVAAFGYASFNIDAEVTVPVTVDVGGIEFKAEFNITTGDIHFFPRNNYYGDPRDGDNPTDYAPLPGEPLPPYPPSLPPGKSPPDEGEEEEEEVIVGVVVTSTSVDSSQIGTLFQQDNPDISIPNLGYVSFFCRVDRLDGAWTTDIPVKSRRQLIPCPWEGGAVSVEGTPRVGVEWTLTPLRSKRKIPFEYPEVV